MIYASTQGDGDGRPVKVIVHPFVQTVLGVCLTVALALGAWTTRTLVDLGQRITALEATAISQREAAQLVTLREFYVAVERQDASMIRLEQKLDEVIQLTMQDETRRQDRDF
jgi:hypothetical protein